MSREPVRGADQLLSKGGIAREHGGLGDINKANWEEPMDPAQASPSEAAFKGGAKLPPAHKTGNLEDDFKGTGFTTMTGKALDADDEPRSRS